MVEKDNCNKCKKGGCTCGLKHIKVLSLPESPEKDTVYYLLGDGVYFPYITDKMGNLIPASAGDIGFPVENITSNEGTITVTNLTGNFNIEISQEILDEINNAGGGVVETVTGLIVDNTDPLNPIVTIPEAFLIPYDDTVTQLGATNVQAAIESLDLSIDSILDIIAEPPTYNSPSAGLTNVTQVVEKGASLGSFNVTISFSQNDAGALNGYSLNRNGVQISSSQTTPVVENNITNTIEYRGIVNYSQGQCKNNNLGIEDCTGRIQAGTVSSPIRTITPRLKTFYGNTTSTPTTSAQVRALPQNDYENDNSLNLVTGDSNKIFVVAVPESKSITQVIDLGNLNANITSEYNLINSNFTVEDAGGNPNIYKLYAMTPAIPYNTSTTHRITLS